jgi:hypothetical protein
LYKKKECGSRAKQNGNKKKREKKREEEFLLDGATPREGPTPKREKKDERWLKKADQNSRGGIIRRRSTGC